MTAATATRSRAGVRERVPLTPSLIALLVTSGVLTLVGVGLPALVAAAIAARKNQEDHAGAHRLTRVGWIILTGALALAAIGAVALWLGTEAGEKFWNWETAAEVTRVLIPVFIKTTLLITVVGTAIAAVLGLAFAVATQALPGLLVRPLRWVMDVVRMTPLIIQLLFVSYLVPVSWDLLWVGTAVIGVHYATYMSESYIAGIGAVDAGQWEAARALSLPTARTWQVVVLPQALRATLPSLGNWAISMFKDTPFLFALYVLEMVTVAQQYGNNTFRYNEVFTIAGLLFLAASLVTAVAVRKLERALVY